VNVTTFDWAFTGISHPWTKLSSVADVYITREHNVRREVMSIKKKNDEIGIAEEIVGILPAGVAREFSSDRGTIRYAVRAEGMKLRTIALSRASLRKLADDPQRAVKIEYLQRDLLNGAPFRCEFRYPRPVAHLQALGRALPLAWPVASAR
jgi:hypothetical protein